MVEGDARSSPATQTRRDAYEIHELTDTGVIRRTLETRRPYAAYALGQLDDRFFGLVHCYQAKGSTGQALLLFSSAGLGNALFAMGDAGALEALLRLHRGPRQNYATCQPEHLPVFKRYFVLAQEQPMLRMSVSTDAYRAPETQAEAVTVRQLRGRDVRPAAGARGRHRGRALGRSGEPQPPPRRVPRHRP